MRAASFIALAVLVAAAAANRASAEPIPDRAKRLAAQGRAAHESGDYDGAIAAFTEANALAPAPALLFNLGQAYRLKGNCDLAGVMYRRYLATGPGVEARTLAEAHLATVQQCALAMDPATRHEIAAAPPVRRDEPPAPGQPQQRVGMGLMIGGGLALAAAAYFTLDAHSAARDVEDAYERGQPGWESAPVDERGKRSEKLAWGLGIGGGALVAGGVISYVIGMRAERDHALAVIPTKRGAGVSYAWRF